jgi:hypothetical protein
MITAVSMAGTTHASTPPRIQPTVRGLHRLLIIAGVGASIALHGQMALSGIHGTMWSLVMGGMAAICASCLVALVKSGPAPGPVGMTMGMALAMALAHVLMLPLLNAEGGAHAHHSPSQVDALATGSGGGHSAMLMVVVVELAVAALAAWWMRRHAALTNRRTSPGPTTPQAGVGPSTTPLQDPRSGAVDPICGRSEPQLTAR